MPKKKKISEVTRKSYWAKWVSPFGIIIGVFLGYVGPDLSSLFLAPPVVVQAPNIECKVAFTPYGQCAQIILQEIQKAEKEILVQAYHLTYRPITNALLEAVQRNVIVKVILDKVMESNEIIFRLKRGGMEVFLDKKPRIAHNKVMILDDHVVVTGSFNFTASAQNANAENVIILKSPEIAKVYKHNWLKRRAASITF